MDGGTEPSSNVTMQAGSGGSNKKNANGPLKESNNHSSGLTKSVNDLEGVVESSNSTQATGTTSLASSASSPLVGTAITDYNRRGTTTNIQQNHPINVDRCNTTIENLVKRHKSNNVSINNNNASKIGTNGNYLLGSPLPSPPGCGCIIRASSPEPDEINISITPTIGGQFDLTVDRNETITNLKKIISNRLKVAKERICLLHRERQLRDGTLRENRLEDGSKLTLLPSVEAGLMGQRPEQSVMQALESLNDSQVNDFLSGKAPLNLTMRVGDQLVLIQLQLSTVTPASPSGSSNGSGVSSSCVPVASASVDGIGLSSQSLSTSNSNNSSPTSAGGLGATMSSGCQSSNLGTTNSTMSTNASMTSPTSSSTSSTTIRSISPLRSAIIAARAARRSSLMSTLASLLQAAAGCNSNTGSGTSNSTSLTTATTTTNSVERSNNSPPNSPNSYNPVTSFSRLSRPPFYRPFGTQNSSGAPSSASPTSSSSTSTSSSSTSSSSSVSSALSPPSFSTSSTPSSTSSPPPSGNPLLSSSTSRVNYRKLSGIPYVFHRQHHRHHYHHHHHHHHSRSKHLSGSNSSSSSPASCETLQPQDSSSLIAGQSQIFDEPMETSTSLPGTPQKKSVCNHHHHHHHHHHNHSQQQTSGASTTNHHQDSQRCPDSPTSPHCPNASNIGLGNSSKVSATLDTRALAEASRNLTQKLKQLSSEVLTSRVDLAEELARRRQGAIIESMHHHGKGVYSGTFSGTLNPALQDRHGRPKRDIGTIIHILNDLLCATPAATAGPYRHHHRHISGRLQSSSNIAGTSDPSTSIGAGTTGAFHDEELSKENEATKGKMRKLRLVMEQRRAKKKARRQWAAVTRNPGMNHDPNTSTSGSASGPSGNASESQNEPELQPCSPEPVVA
ncbi:midnolin homolog isoform X2 [Venturia canescens]|uniref:midnolin homolog isoform X2 n=1 Tax=Venturia canescens TaxID=32260 RepID=UPI001C9C16F2|nr:midnolin homolog isoform X2 [Venturia canescens]